MTTPRRPRFLALLAAALALAAAAPARASEADVFENKIEPVSGQLYRKAGRFELTPSGSLSVLSPFYTNYFVGAKLGYHFTESWSAHASFAAGFASPNGSTTICTRDAGCAQAPDPQLYQVPGRLKAIGGVEVAWAPVYGKLNLFAEQVMHFDVSLFAGPDWISSEQVLAGDAARTGAKPASTSSIGGHVGVGVRIFLSRVLAARLELKDYVYSAEIGNLGERRLQYPLVFDLGLSIFFPGTGRSP